MSRRKGLAGYLIGHPFMRFGFVGACGYVVDLSVLALATDWGHLSFESGRAFSIFCAMCFTWIGNRYLTFRERRARTLSGAFQEWLRFVGANLLGAVVNYAVSVALLRYGPFPLNYKYAAQVLGVLAGLVFNFTLSRAFVFKK
jgi:dolichol-phosphate mannosyltransferase